jgi:6-pyruvoyl-tetrahydropterin synthase
MKSASQLTLSVFHQFKASHTLAGFETPHFHLWKCIVEFSAHAPFQGDRLIDLVFLQGELNAITLPVANQYLNSIFDFPPTSENIAQWLWKQAQVRLPQANLTSVTVTLCDLEGNASGAARLV